MRACCLPIPGCVMHRSQVLISLPMTNSSVSKKARKPSFSAGVPGCPSKARQFDSHRDLRPAKRFDCRMFRAAVVSRQSAKSMRLLCHASAFPRPESRLYCYRSAPPSRTRFFTLIFILAEFLIVHSKKVLQSRQPARRNDQISPR